MHIVFIAEKCNILDDLLLTYFNEEIYFKHCFEWKKDVFKLLLVLKSDTVKLDFIIMKTNTIGKRALLFKYLQITPASKIV